jgi:hypothetical protein
MLVLFTRLYNDALSTKHKNSVTCNAAINTWRKLSYILESNPHPFYSFIERKNQMRIRIACGLDWRSRAGFWKNDRAAVRAVRTIQYNNLLFYLLFVTHKARKSDNG